MQRIKSICIRNVKGLDMDLTLGPVNLIYGRNFKHKTSVSDAVKIGLLGYHPSLGKRNPDTWDLAGPGTAMSVALALEDPEMMLLHDWKKNGNGTISYTKDCPLSFGVPAILLDVKEYFEKTTADKIRYVFEQVPVEDWSDDNVTKAIAGIEALPYKVAVKHVEALNKQVAQSIADRKAKNLTIQEWLNDLIESLKGAKKAADAVLKRESGVTVGIRRQMDAIPKVTDQKEQIAKLKAELAEVDKQIAEFNAAINAANSVATRRNFLTDEVGKRPDLSDKIKATEKKIRDAKSDLIKRTPVQTNAKDELEQARKAKVQAQEKVVNLMSAVEKIQKEIEDLKGMSACPFCKSNGANWKEHLASDLAIKLVTTQSELTEASSAITKAEEKEFAAKTKLDAVEQAAKVYGQAKFDLVQLESNLKSLQSEQNLTAQYKTELANLGNVPVPDRSLLTTLPAKKSEVSGKLENMEVLQQQFEQKQRLLGQGEKAESDQINQSVESEVLKKAIEKLIAIQAEMVTETFGKLLETAKLFTDGLLPSSLMYQEGELGRMDGLHWIKHRTFSGTEQALAFAGMSVALASRSPVKVVLMDEMGRIHPDLKPKVLKRMCELVQQGHISQFIGIDVTLNDYLGAEIERVKFIEMK